MTERDKTALHIIEHPESTPTERMFAARLLWATTRMVPDDEAREAVYAAWKRLLALAAHG